MIHRLLLATVLLLPTALSMAAACADETPRADEPRWPSKVVVLHNGSAIQGRVEESRDRLIVSNGPWYVVRVPRNDVDFVAADFAAAFRIQRARLGASDLQGHLKLAQWCVRHDLDQLAADQLLHLVRLDPHHPAVETLEQQLRRRAEAKPFSESDARRTLAAQGERRSPGPWGEETEAENLPPMAADALAEFTRSVQPLLLNRCGQTTCHGSAGQSRFELQRLMASGEIRRSLTLRNLRSVIAQIDTAHLRASPVLEMATRPHGTAQQAPLGPHDQRQYERLHDWVSWVVNGEPVHHPATGDSLTAPSRLEALGIAAPLAEATSGRARTIEGSVPPVLRRNATEPARSAAAVDSEPSDASSDDLDPYDPAAFNARFSTDAPVADEGR
jgi:hypothetical protein